MRAEIETNKVCMAGGGSTRGRLIMEVFPEEMMLSGTSNYRRAHHEKSWLYVG